jgi:anaerobic carbon-monoxide dehydrogenase iron sulfur subunit
MEKFLTVNAEKCTGCRLCEQVCSVVHEGVSNPAKSRIQIVKWEDEGRYIPMICQQCEDAPCQNV